jgi:hypothetical protein
VLRRSSLVECGSLLHGTGVYKASNFFLIHQYVHPCLSKNPEYTFYTIKSSFTLAYEVGTAMNARASENYLAISRSSSASKSVEILWAEIYWGRPLFRAESNLIQSSCRSFIRVIVPYEISKVNFA